MGYTLTTKVTDIDIRPSEAMNLAYNHYSLIGKDEHELIIDKKDNKHKLIFLIETNTYVATYIGMSEHDDSIVFLHIDAIDEAYLSEYSDKLIKEHSAIPRCYQPFCINKKKSNEETS